MFKRDLSLANELSSRKACPNHYLVFTGDPHSKKFLVFNTYVKIPSGL